MKKIIRGIVAAASLVSGISLTTAVIAYGSGYFKEGVVYTDSSMTKAVEHSEIEYNVNAEGQTFGSSANIIYTEDLPDLIIVVGDNGKTGYVYADELFGNAPSSPEEAVKIQESLDNGTYVPKVYNVYESDGKTVIDTFTETLPD